MGKIGPFHIYSFVSSKGHREKISKNKSYPRKIWILIEVSIVNSATYI